MEENNYKIEKTGNYVENVINRLGAFLGGNALVNDGGINIMRVVPDGMGRPYLRILLPIDLVGNIHASSLNLNEDTVISTRNQEGELYIENNDGSLALGIANDFQAGVGSSAVSLKEVAQQLNDGTKTRYISQTDLDIKKEGLTVDDLDKAVGNHLVTRGDGNIVGTLTIFHDLRRYYYYEIFTCNYNTKAFNNFADNEIHQWRRCINTASLMWSEWKDYAFDPATMASKADATAVTALTRRVKALEDKLGMSQPLPGINDNQYGGGIS